MSDDKTVADYAEDMGEFGFEFKAPRGGVPSGICAPLAPCYEFLESNIIRWQDISEAASLLQDRVWPYCSTNSKGDDTGGNRITGVYGVPRGGVPVAVWLAFRLNLPLHDQVSPLTLVVDDLVDTGKTLNAYRDQTPWIDALFRKSHSPDDLAPDAVLEDGWLVFPWEADTDEEEGPTEHVTRLLQYIGEDPTRDGLVKTPERVVKALREMTAGYRTDIAALLAVTFKEEHDELIVIRRVPFYSLCEHHMLPFHGHATVGYVPRNGIVGLSKLARLVEAFARRLQVQERMTDQIAGALDEHLHPLAVGVILEAQHSCMAMRGIQREATMVTSKLTGLLRERADLRSEFMSLHHA